MAETNTAPAAQRGTDGINLVCLNRLEIDCYSISHYFSLIFYLHYFNAAKVPKWHDESRSSDKIFSAPVLIRTVPPGPWQSWAELRGESCDQGGARPRSLAGPWEAGHSGLGLPGVSWAEDYCHVPGPRSQEPRLTWSWRWRPSWLLQRWLSDIWVHVMTVTRQVKTNIFHNN